MKGKNGWEFIFKTTKRCIIFENKLWYIFSTLILVIWKKLIQLLSPFVATTGAPGVYRLIRWGF